MDFAGIRAKREEEAVVQMSVAELRRAFRTTRFRLSQANKQLGKQGATIFALRNEVAALRAAVQWNPGDRARLLAENTAVIVENRRLKEKLASLSEVVPQ